MSNFEPIEYTPEQIVIRRQLISEFLDKTLIYASEMYERLPADQQEKEDAASFVGLLITNCMINVAQETARQSNMDAGMVARTYLGCITDLFIKAFGKDLIKEFKGLTKPASTTLQ